MTEPTEDTLPTGEKVWEYADGRQVLQPSNSLAAALEQQTDEQEIASEALCQALIDAATSKREAQASGNAVPADKRVI